ncbi:hypothetical protein APY04_0868 [Hyphomicrobium sulfonivorans]|uniref:Uncharacterized protein n=1 Tax=Hyphomicrobium sulfonivorans TaxID=121290 RepID=A0A120CX93_HYPSL|nr:hypothetical protein APY04_0868 [Hyphomicrobium sulfonivorans]
MTVAANAMAHAAPLPKLFAVDRMMPLALNNRLEAALPVAAIATLCLQ